MSLANPLKPPTDNLYKFAAISGLLLIVLAVAVFCFLLNRVAEANMEFNRNLRVVWVAVAHEAQARDAINGAMQMVLQNQAPNNLAWELKQVGVDAAAVSLAVSLQDAADRFILERVLISQWGLPFSVVLAVVGFICTLSGFASWYQRVLRHEDEMLWRRARDAKIRSSSSPRKGAAFLLKAHVSRVACSPMLFVPPPLFLLLRQ